MASAPQAAQTTTADDLHQDATDIPQGSNAP
jgi:hypothetical protein